MSENNKITWQKVLQAIIQAAIAALTALGITSCTTFLFSL
ncbi:smalltalk protein [Phocaeicola vulgatus]